MAGMQYRLSRWILPLLLVSTACAADLAGGETCEGEKCDELGKADYVSAGEYRFCLSPAGASAAEREEIDDAFVDMPLPNLESVQFLAHMADLAYWDPADIGPELERLGFGKPGDGIWLGNCAIDASIVRDSKLEDPFLEPDLSSCATDWKLAGGEDAQSFFRYVNGEVHPDRDIEFFSAGYQTLVDGEYEQGSTQMFWAKHRTEPWIIMAFRGTSDGGDVWVDLNYPTKPFITALPDWGIVHGGFYDAYRSITNLLDQRLFAVQDQDARIWVTGHSLGGALASLATAELLARVDRGLNLKLGGMATFGSPRVGDTAFYKRAEGIAIERGVALHRVRNISNSTTGYDPVVHVPFQSTLGDEFQHLGAPIGLFEDGTLTYALEQNRWVPPFGLIEDAIAQLKEHLVDMLSSAFPHGLGHYHERLARAASKPLYDNLHRCGSRN